MKKFNYNFWSRQYVAAAGEGFAGVFLGLHPFVKVEGLKPAPCGYEFDFTELDPQHPFYTLGQDSHGWRATASVVKRSGVAVTWAQVVHGAGLRDARQVCQAYYSHFNRLVEPFNDGRVSAQLLEYTIKNNLVLPDEDRIATLYEIPIGALYKRMGIETIFVGHDWHDEWSSLKVEALLDPMTSILEVEGIRWTKCFFSSGHDIVTVSCVDGGLTCRRCPKSAWLFIFELGRRPQIVPRPA